MSTSTLSAVLASDGVAVWHVLAPILPPGCYLGGGTAVAIHLHHRRSHDLDFFFHDPEVDLVQLEREITLRAPFAVTNRAAGTLNGVVSSTRVQFLLAGMSRAEFRLEQPILTEGVPVAAIGDLLAMKLNAVAGRGQLRDYFDLMEVERVAGRTAEEGLSLFLARYRPENPDAAVKSIVLALGHFDDVMDDPSLPIDRTEVETYWRLRQPELIQHAARFDT